MSARPDSAPPPEANPRLARPRPPATGDDPVAFVRESLRMAWRLLTRMRTALYLLAGLALLTMLATAVPQQPNVPSTVDAWRAGEEGPGTLVSAVIDVVGGYDVYGSALFLALLLLIYLSLTACLTRRIRSWVRLVRRSQPPLLRHGPAPGDQLARLVTDRTPAEVEEAGRELLGSKRWRVRAPAAEASTSAGQIAAERGLWSREGGSLLFHCSFYVLLAAIVVGQLTTFEGQRGVVEAAGDSQGIAVSGFTDAPISYWTYRPGRWWGEDEHAGWRLELERFHVDWIRDPLAAGAGQPTTFASDVLITPADGEPFRTTIEGNHPLVVDGQKIHQLDWGYAPRIVVEVDGEVVHDGFVTAQIGDSGYFETAVKAAAADPDIGLEVLLWPFAPDDQDSGLPALTGAPWDDDPLVLYRQWRGDLQLGATQQTITQLDTDRLASQGGGFLRLGQSLEVEGVTVTFVELRRWVGFQVSQRPQIPWLLLGAGLLTAGLVTALYAYRRRLWVVAVRDDDDRRTIVTVAGRAFQRSDVFADEHARIVEALAHATDAATIVPPRSVDRSVERSVENEPAVPGSLGPPDDPAVPGGTTSGDTSEAVHR